MKHEIEKGIPMPESAKLDFRQKYPLTKMEIGDSFIFEFTSPKQLEIFRISIRKQRCINKKDFAIQFIDRKSKLRCWRTK